MTDEQPGAEDVLTAVSAVSDVLMSAAEADGWDAPAGTLEWPCRVTLGHIVDCLAWYAALLARRASGPVEVAEVDDDAPAARLLDALRSSGALLAAAVTAASPEDRGWHSYGIADRSGFAAMGCDEALVHGYDLACGLGLPYQPPREVAERTLRRLFPWAPADADPWAALLWANGRQPLGDRPPETRWLWHCAPLDEWDGQIRRKP